MTAIEASARGAEAPKAPSSLDELAAALRALAPSAEPGWAAACTALERTKRGAADDLALAYQSYRAFRELRNRSLSAIGAAKSALNRATQEGRPQTELSELSARIAAIEEPAAQALREHDRVHGIAVARWLEADAAEAQLVYDAVRTAHGCERRGAVAEGHGFLRAAAVLARFFVARDEALLGRAIDEHAVRARSSEPQTVRTITLWDTLSSKAADDRALEARRARRRSLRVIETFFAELRERQRLVPGPADLPAAIAFEPGLGPDAERFHEQVVMPGLAQVYVPDWQTRVLVPLDLVDALAQSDGRTLYMTPGSGSQTSNALSSTTAAMDIARDGGRWHLAPFLVDCPHHAFGPFGRELHEKDAVLRWMTGHLAQLEQRTRRKPVYAGRSTGGLFGLEIARFEPSSVACVIALSPPSPGADWQAHMARFYDSGELDAPDLHGYGWFNGGDALAELAAAKGSPELRELRDAPSVRRSLEALESPLDARERAVHDRPTVLILYGIDDTAQYPDRPELFRELCFPNLPLDQIWREAEARYDHVRTFALPGGHFQFPVDRPTFRRIARDLVRRFVQQPRAFRKDHDGAEGVAQFLRELDARLAPLLRVRALRIELWQSGCTPDAIVDAGADRLDRDGDEEALRIWEMPEMRAYIATRPGALF